ncbi:MAG: GNAT family N-acetyltransferase [Haloglomus sp.]
MPGAVFLRGNGIELRRVTPGDTEFLARNRNDPRVRGSFPDPTPPTRYGLETSFDERYESDDHVSLLVCPTDEGGGDPVGMVALLRIDDVNGTAELGYWTTPDAQGEGYATAGARRLLAYAFTERRLERVFADALATNEASRAVLETLGFVEEGRERAAFVQDGERVDRVNYGLLADEFEK